MVLSLTLSIIHIFATIAVDDQYKALAANLSHTGRGRPPSQPKGIQYDNRLLVQLKTLRSEGQKTLDDVQVFFQKCFPDIDRTASSISWPFSSTTGTPSCPKPACSSRWCPACHPTYCFRFWPFWAWTFKTNDQKEETPITIYSQVKENSTSRQWLHSQQWQRSQ